jgi:spore coat polysaccharide biosynthesis protein SpsF
MTVTCIVQARMGSTRLPGKVLADLDGRPMLTFMLDRIAGLPIDNLVVATTDASLDDAVEEAAHGVGVAVVRGPEHDVLARFGVALDAYPADVIVRLTADCPLVDPEVAANVIACQRDTMADYASNTLVRTYPDGLDVEVVTATALRTAIDEALEPAEREHVTPFIYRRPERFRLVTVTSGHDLGNERWTVDTGDDLKFVRDVVARLDPASEFRWRDVLEVVGRRVMPRPGTMHLAVAPDSEPKCRRWRARIDETDIGAVSVAVTNGVGRLSMDLRDQRDAEAITALVRRALTSDFQVRRLEPPDSQSSGSISIRAR